MPTDDPDELAESIRRDTVKTVESVRRQRGALYEVEHASEGDILTVDDAGAEPDGSVDSADSGTLPPPKLDS